MSDISRRQFSRGALGAIGLRVVAAAVPAGAGSLLLTGPADAASTAVVPIDFASLVKPTDAITNRVATILRNTNQFAVTTWWNTTKNYDAQTGAYLNFGGTAESIIRPPAAQAFGLATALSLGVYSATQTGVTLANAQAMAVRLIGSLAYRHRVNLGSTGWGSVWQSAHWAAFAGTAGWLLWDKLSTTDREYVRKMVEYEANRFNTWQPAYYRNVDGTYASPGDTQAESVAWNNTVVALAASMMPNHANKTTWMKQVVALSLKANSRPDDVGTGPSSGKTINGFRLGSMTGTNVNQDGTVVNHDRIHPDYMESFAINLSGALTLALSKQDTPYAVRRSYNNMYAALVDHNFPAGTMPYTDPKLVTQTIRTPGGKIYAGTTTNPDDTSDIYYPMGNDWGTGHRMNYATMDVFADSFKEDDLASVKGATWATQHLTKVQKQQERSTDRRTFISSSEFNYNGAEEWVSHHAAWAYLARVVTASGRYKITSASY
ncbi:hypothetical protein OG259_37530 [Streptomyces sp. NBC_00250]|uniref:hypothetical protein n=1 Tax=Streptomyces sp. NBC_00250 TaxID=2903641 RepID=UPI002E283952|nr:hypothetical protein [Streptomyces sp. NBC_00250]